LMKLGMKDVRARGLMLVLTYLLTKLQSGFGIILAVLNYE